MKINFKTLRKSVGIRIVGALLVANVFAFSFASTYINSDTEPIIEQIDTDNKSILETGWQVMHWSYSLLELLG